LIHDSKKRDFSMTS